MVKKHNRDLARRRRHARIRSKISGTSEIPRMSVFRSNKAIYVQLIDDVTGKTLVSCSSKELNLSNNNIETCKQVGTEFAKKAQGKGISKVKFDRGGYVYHGKVQAIADSARESGLKI